MNLGSRTPVRVAAVLLAAVALASAGAPASAAGTATDLEMSVAGTGSPDGSAVLSRGGDHGDGGGAGGGLPVTGVRAGLIGGIGLAVLVVGGLLFLVGRRRPVVLVPPGADHQGTDQPDANQPDAGRSTD